MLTEPWKCYHCCELMYNKDQDGYPIEGSPIGCDVTIDGTSARLCITCAQIYELLLSNNYMRTQHRVWLEEQEKKYKLKIGNKYLD
jgi:hypothetical protein